MRKASSVEEYRSGLDERKLAALDRLREVIASAVPAATEGISYAMPAFPLHGRGLVCYAAFKNHYSLFPMSAKVVTDVALRR